MNFNDFCFIRPGPIKKIYSSNANSHFNLLYMAIVGRENEE